jgi:lysophospholipase L1-like esterase
MKDLMMNTFDGDLTQKWNFKEYTPDLVVINLGSNDFSTKPHPLKEEFLKAYEQILSQLREVYGDVPVLCIAPPKGPAFEYVQSFCKERGDKNLHFTAYLQGVYNGDSDLGSSGHPNYEGQKKIAMNLIPYISTVTGWELSGKIVK